MSFVPFLSPSTKICSQDVGLLELKLLDIFTSSTCPNEVGLKSGTKPWWILTWFPHCLFSSRIKIWAPHTKCLFSLWIQIWAQYTHAHTNCWIQIWCLHCVTSQVVGWHWSEQCITTPLLHPNKDQGTNEQARCLSGVRGWMPPKWRQQLLIHLEVGDSKKNCPCKIQGVATGYLWAMYT